MNDLKLPIYHKLYQLLKYLYQIEHHMPREHKHGIGKDAIAIGWECLDNSIEAGYSKGDKKDEAKKRLCAAFDRLKLRLRLASEIGAVSEGCFAHLQENYMLEIGRMIGGWGKEKGLESR